MAEASAKRSGIYDAPGDSPLPSGEGKKSIGVYDRPEKSAFPKSLVWIILLILLIVLAVVFVF